MLILKVFVNTEQIDEAWVHNEGECKDIPGLFKYRIKRPEGYGDIEILHQQGQGYAPLVEQVMAWLKRRGHSKRN